MRGRPPKRPIKDATKKQLRDKLHYINENAEEAFDASRLSFVERRLLVVMADPRQAVERWTITQTCEAAGIGYAAYKAAMANPEFVSALNSVVKNMIRQAVLPLVRAGVQFAMDGSFRHWEALLRMGGQIDAESEENEIVIRFAGAAAPTVIEAEIMPLRVPGFEDRPRVDLGEVTESDPDPARADQAGDPTGPDDD